MFVLFLANSAFSKYSNSHPVNISELKLKLCNTQVGQGFFCWRNQYKYNILLFCIVIITCSEWPNTSSLWSKHTLWHLFMEITFHPLLVSNVTQDTGQLITSWTDDMWGSWQDTLNTKQKKDNIFSNKVQQSNRDSYKPWLTIIQIKKNIIVHIWVW